MTDQDLLTELQYALIEPPDGGQSWPSEAFTREEVLGLVTSQTWALLNETGALVTRIEITVTAASLGIVVLPPDWMGTAHAVWRSAANVRTPLGPADAFEADLALIDWQVTPGTPIVYLDLDTENLRMRLAPRPDADGTLELMYVQRTAETTGAGAAIPVPDELIAGIKYATLGGLLRKVGRLLDPERAKYCEDRYDLTVLVTKILLGGFA